MSFRILSVDATAATMVIDWGDVTLNHYIPREILSSGNFDEPAILQLIESIRPSIPEPVIIPSVLLGLVEPPQQPEEERRWRDMTMLPLLALRDRHRDEEALGIPTTLAPLEFAVLLTYIQALREWPQSADFPDSSKRPSPPEFVRATVSTD